MGKPTGPGKTQNLPKVGPGRVRRRGLLYNFDVDGDSLKPQHAKWLDENIVPMLPNPLLSIRLRGLASRSGSAAYNEQLSFRRTNSVKAYLTQKGASASQFVNVGAGEQDAATAGQVDGSEDEMFRGVIVSIASAKAVKVEFEHVLFGQKENGFDTTVTPRFLLVPHENPTREIRISNAGGCQIRSRDTGIAVPMSFLRSQLLTEIDTDDEVIRVSGRLPGKTFFDVLDGPGNVVASLEVSIARKLQVRTSFHYVKHSSVGTTRRLGSEHALILEMNEIYMAQANIEFVHHSARELPLTAAFGTEVNESARLANGKTEWEEITGNRNRGARFNVFFVKELEVADEGVAGDDADALATIGGVDCIFEDDSGIDVGETLAHEAGHALGCRHNKPITSSVNMLMWDTTDERGHFLPKVHVELMRNKV